MFLPLRDLRFALGRFSLIGGVVGLLAVLVTFLTGLSSGLVDSGISGLRRLPVTHLAFASGSGAVFSQSQLGPEALARWGHVATYAQPVGVAFVNGTSVGGAKVALAMFGADPAGGLVPRADTGRTPGPGQLLVSEKTMRHGLHVGDRITLSGSGAVLTVAGVGTTGTYGHAEVAYTPLATWQRAMTGGRNVYSAIALRLPAAAAVEAVDSAAGTELFTKTAAYKGSPGYSAETATMSLIRGFLYLVAALVLGAFFVIWTIERTRQIALLKALGASTMYVLGAALAQVGIVVVVAVAAGTAAGTLAGALVGGGIPFALHTRDVVLAAVLLVVFGICGVLAPVRRITRVDPVIALGIER